MNRALKWVTIMDLRLPGDFKARLASEGVRQLADSGDILQPPAIRKEDSSVIFGGDRLAAVHKRGNQQAEVWVIDCTEDEAEEMRLVENAFRRETDHGARAALVARHLAAIDARKATQEAINFQSKEKPKRGRPLTAEGAARAEVAAATGVSKNALEVQAHREKAEQRSEAGAQQGDGNQSVPAPAGVAPPPGADIAEKLDAINALLVQATGLVTKLAKEHPELVERFQLQALKFKLQREVAPGFRAIRPLATCGYCKLVASELPNCGACKGSGWLTQDQHADMPGELLVTGDGAGIFMDGKFVTLVQLAAEAFRRTAKKTSALRELLSSPDVKSVRRTGGAGGQQMPRTMDLRVVDEAGHEEPWSDTWAEES